MQRDKNNKTHYKRAFVASSGDIITDYIAPRKDEQKSNTLCTAMAYKAGFTLSVLCRVCHVFPPLVSIFGLFPVLVSCHYELSMFQLCLSRYVLITLCILVLSFEFDFVRSTRYSPVFLSMSVLPCPALMSTLKTII